jgi:hypothetical protein
MLTTNRTARLTDVMSDDRSAMSASLDKARHLPLKNRRQIVFKMTLDYMVGLFTPPTTPAMGRVRA